MSQFSNGKQSIPPLFKAIMENDAQRKALQQQTVVSFSEATGLQRQHRDYMRAAEQALSWNKDKGNQSQ